MDEAAHIEWPDGRLGVLSGTQGWTVDGRAASVGDVLAAAPALQGFVLEQTERVVLDALAGSPAEALLRELLDAQRALCRPDEQAAHDEDSGVLRLSVTAEGAELDEPALNARMSAIFPGGVEETRDARGRLEVAAYESPPVTLPPSLGPWRVEAVDASRTRAWREEHHGIEVAGRLWVGPPDEPPAPGLVAVLIDPRRSFGAGAHATTHGCLELLCGLDQRGSVLDLGCGSGVLAIAAAVLGHAPVMACDSDPLAVEAARHNVRMNRVEVEVFEADVVVAPLPRADLWLANLLHGPVRDVLARADAPARVIVSGIEETQELSAPGYRVAGRIARAGWQALLLDRE